MADPDDLSHILFHLGEERDQYRMAVAPPVFQSSIYTFASVADMRRGLADELATPFYTRGNNPTVEILRRKLAALEGAEDALAFASGSAAIAAAVIAFAAAGRKIVCVERPYSWTRKLLERLLPGLGVDAVFVPGDVAAFAEAVDSDTSLVLLESPNSMTFEQQDIAAIAAIAHERGARVLVDNSYATPLLQRPLALGADLVAHSASKYLNGHTDVVAGALMGSAADIRRVFEGPYMTLGAALSPHDAWLMIRGLRTLPIRLERIRATAAAIVEFLREQPQVARLHYPDTAVAGGLLSIELAADAAGIERFCNALERFLLACSWGGYESLVFPLCALDHSQNYQANAAALNRLVRLSIGLEDAGLLIADLRQALRKI